MPPGVVFLRLTGQPSPSQLVNLLEALRRYPPRLPVLMDCRGMAIPTSAVIEDVAGRLAPPHPYDPAISCVILVTPGWSDVAAIVGRYLPSPRTHPCHVCWSWQEAIHALGLSADELPESPSSSRR